MKKEIPGCTKSDKGSVAFTDSERIELAYSVFHRPVLIQMETFVSVINHCFYRISLKKIISNVKFLCSDFLNEHFGCVEFVNATVLSNNIKKTDLMPLDSRF